MSGFPNYNREFMWKLEQRIRGAMNVPIWNPANLNEEQITPFTWENVMRRNIVALLHSDAMLLVNYNGDYFRHAGTLLEHRIASDLHIRIIDWAELEMHINKIEATHIKDGICLTSL